MDSEVERRTHTRQPQALIETPAFESCFARFRLLKFHPTQYRLFSSSDDCKLHYWNLENKKCVCKGTCEL